MNGTVPDIESRGGAAIDGLIHDGAHAVLTVVFTDIEGSTRLWEEHPDDMERAVRDHNQIVSSVVMASSGRVLRFMGDGVLALFLEAGEAVHAAIDLQRAFVGRAWPGVGELRIRIGINTGHCRIDAGEIFGRPPNLAARLESAAHGGQILLSDQTARAVAGVLGDDEQLFELGRYHIRGFDEPVVVHSVVAEGLTQVFPPLRTPYLGFDELPSDDSLLYGRDELATDVASLLATHRLVTLWGPGGVGKTRLAVHVAARARRPYEQGVRLVDLSSLEDPTFVVRSVASALRAQPTAGEREHDTVLRVLRHAQILLVLDNCDRVLDGVRELVAAIVERSRTAHVLATSREALRVRGECVVEVPMLAVPDDGETAPGRVAASDAARLLIDRARDVDPRFRVTAANAGLVAALCRAVDGLPLALELAAARLDVETIEDLVDDLPSLFTRLESSVVASEPAGALLPLRWNLSRLADDEIALFRRLGVFAGSFSRGMARRLVAGGDEADRAFDRLVRTSVVVRDAAAPDRFRLLSAAREAAGSGMGDAERAAARASHAAVMLERAERFGPLIRTLDERAAVETLRADFLDHHHAFEFFMEQHATVQAARLVSALFEFAMFQPRPELFRWAATVAAHLDDRAPHASEMLGAAAMGAWFSGDIDRALELGARAIDVGSQHGGSTLWARWALVDALGYADRLDELETHFLALVQESRESADPFWQLNALAMEAIGFATIGHPRAAEERAERALVLARRTGNPDCIHWASYALGRVLAPTDPVAASAAFEQAAEAARQVESRFNAGLALVEWVTLRRQGGDHRTAAAGCLDLLDMLAVSGNRAQLSHVLRESGLVLADAGRHELAALVLLARRGLPMMPRSPQEAPDDEARLSELRGRLDDTWPRISIRAKAMPEHELISLCRAELAEVLQT